MCAAGQYSPGGSTQCSNCASGQYSAFAGSSSCTACAAGTVAAAGGLSVCSSCLPGTYTSTTGLTSCVLCGSGQYSPGGAVPCTCRLVAQGCIVELTGCTPIVLLFFSFSSSVVCAVVCGQVLCARLDCTAALRVLRLAPAAWLARTRAAARRRAPSATLAALVVPTPRRVSPVLRARSAPALARRRAHRVQQVCSVPGGVLVVSVLACRGQVLSEGPKWWRLMLSATSAWV